MIILDGATNFLYAAPLDDLSDASGQRALREFMHHMQVKPKRIVGDSAFMEPSWEKFYTTDDIKPVTMGPHIPWPNRAEASVRLLKKHIYQLYHDVSNDPVRKAGITTQDIIREGCWARNVSCTYGGKTPVELAFGRRPPDIISVENATPGQLITSRLGPDETINTLRKLALSSYLKVRQAEDLRQDISSSLKFMGGPFSCRGQRTK